MMVVVMLRVIEVATDEIVMTVSSSLRAMVAKANRAELGAPAVYEFMHDVEVAAWLQGLADAAVSA